MLSEGYVALPDDVKKPCIFATEVVYPEGCLPIATENHA